MTTQEARGRSPHGRSVSVLGVSVLVIVVVISGMIGYISKQTAAMEQARGLRELRREKETLEDRYQRLASQVALLEKSERIHRLASQNLAMLCPTSPSAELYSAHLASADTTPARTGRGIAVLASGVIAR